jgi:hypothetical protein
LKDRKTRIDRGSDFASFKAVQDNHLVPTLVRKAQHGHRLLLVIFHHSQGDEMFMPNLLVLRIFLVAVDEEFLRSLQHRVIA